MGFDWSSPPTPLRRTERLVTQGPVWLISDLHLGDGTSSDAFFGKDRHLLALMERVNAVGATLVVNGDALDFQQAWGFTRILRAHREVLTAMSWLGQRGRLYYVVGNHDYDVGMYSDILNFRVCNELILNDRILIRHGHEYDPYISEMLEQGQWHTVVHHLVERWLGTWIRVPLAEFYTIANRLSIWTGHKLGLTAKAAQKLGRWLGDDEEWGAELLAHLDLWCWSNQGDSMGIFRPAMQDALTGPYDAVVCGHSHLPGVVRRDGRVYANSGSWTFGSAQYLVIEDGEVRCQDWISGRAYREELYRKLLDGSVYERSFFAWWAENYMGWLRFREGEERVGRVPGWISWGNQLQTVMVDRAPPASPAPTTPALTEDPLAPEGASLAPPRAEATPQEPRPA
jgi:UDP-2,3-diacylglucosamine pyrophosphatase LpxH